MAGVIVASCYGSVDGDIGIVAVLSTGTLDLTIHIELSGVFISGGIYTFVPPYYQVSNFTGLQIKSGRDTYYNRIWVIPHVRNFGEIAVPRNTKVEVWNSFFEDRAFGAITETGDTDSLVSLEDFDTPGSLVGSGTFNSLESKFYKALVDDLVIVSSVDVTYDWNFAGSGDTNQVLRILAELKVFPDLVIVPDSRTIPEGGTVDYNTTGGSGAFGAIDWSVTGDSTIDANGTVTAGTAGVYTVTAHDTVADYYDTAVLIVTSPVFIIPDTAVVEIGYTFDFNATGGSTTAYEWSVDGGNTIHAVTGVFTAGEVGVWTVTVYEPTSGFSDTALVAVYDSGFPTIIRGQAFPTGLF